MNPLTSTFTTNNDHNDNFTFRNNSIIHHNYSNTTLHPTTLEQNTPCTLASCDTIGNVHSTTVLRALLDTGSSKTLIHKRVVPRNHQLLASDDDLRITSLAGTTNAPGLVLLGNIRFQEFNRNITIDKHPALIVDGDGLRYDVIFGADFLDKLGFIFDYDNHVVTWMGHELPLRDIHQFFSTSYFHELFLPLEIDQENDHIGETYMDSYATRIMDAKYEQANIDDVAFGQTQLSLDQRRDLHAILSKHTKLFDGSLGVYPHKKVHIDLKPNAVPVHHRAYPVPHLHRDTFKKELNHMVNIGIITPCGASEWASPAFIVPKKDGRVRQITDLRTLNKSVIRKKYPLPIITDILDRVSGYKFFTKLDISMQYYTFELDKESQELCVIVTPFGKYKYLRLPMGLKCAPDFAQQVMEEVLRDVACEVYLDDIGAFSPTWEEHILLLDKILHRLEANGFTVNPLK